MDFNELAVDLQLWLVVKGEDVEWSGGYVELTQTGDWYNPIYTYVLTFKEGLKLKIRLLNNRPSVTLEGEFKNVKMDELNLFIKEYVKERV